MRSDMFEVIIERPRCRGGWGSHGRRDERRRQQEASLREPMNVRRESRKLLNENLAPLRRFLRRRVGKSWDAVRSEICARITPRSAVQKHVLDHVKQMVEEHPVLIDGVPHAPRASGPQRDVYYPINAFRRDAFYICPTTGRLCIVTRPRKRRPWIGKA